MIFKSNTSKLAKAERMGIVDEVSEHYMKSTEDILGPFMDKQSEHAVFNHAPDSSKIVKVMPLMTKGSRILPQLKSSKHII